MHWIFKTDSGHLGVAFNFSGNPADDLGPFAHGYHRAGKRLVDVLTSSNGFPDYDGYPILFLYRHSFELYMKAIIYRGAQFLRLAENLKIDTSKIYRDHRLSPLLPAFRAVFEAVGWKMDTDLPGMRSFKEFSELINGIEEIDPRSFSFRYPLDPKGKAVFTAGTIIDVIQFTQYMDPILEMLAGAVTGLNEEFDAAAEFKYIIQSFILSDETA